MRLRDEIQVYVNGIVNLAEFELCLEKKWSNQTNKFHYINQINHWIKLQHSDIMEGGIYAELSKKEKTVNWFLRDLKFIGRDLVYLFSSTVNYISSNDNLTLGKIALNEQKVIDGFRGIERYSDVIFRNLEEGDVLSAKKLQDFILFKIDSFKSFMKQCLYLDISNTEMENERLKVRQAISQIEIKLETNRRKKRKLDRPSFEEMIDPNKDLDELLKKFERIGYIKRSNGKVIWDPADAGGNDTTLEFLTAFCEVIKGPEFKYLKKSNSSDVQLCHAVSNYFYDSDGNQINLYKQKYGNHRRSKDHNRQKDIILDIIRNR